MFVLSRRVVTRESLNSSMKKAADWLLPIDLIPTTEAVLIWKAQSLNIGVELKFSSICAFFICTQEVQFCTKAIVKIFIFQQLHFWITNIAGHAQINVVLQFFHINNYKAFWDLLEAFFIWRCIKIAELYFVFWQDFFGN